MLRRAEMTERFPVLCQEPGSPRLPSLPPFLPPTPSRTHRHVLLWDGPTAPLPAQASRPSCPPRLLPWPGRCATGPHTQSSAPGPLPSALGLCGAAGPQLGRWSPVALGAEPEPCAWFGAPHTPHTALHMPCTEPRPRVAGPSPEPAALTQGSGRPRPRCRPRGAAHLLFPDTIFGSPRVELRAMV